MSIITTSLAVSSTARAALLIATWWPVCPSLFFAALDDEVDGREKKGSLDVSTV